MRRRWAPTATSCGGHKWASARRVTAVGAYRRVKAGATGNVRTVHYLSKHTCYTWGLFYSAGRSDRKGPPELSTLCTKCVHCPLQSQRWESSFCPPTVHRISPQNLVTRTQIRKHLGGQTWDDSVRIFGCGLPDYAEIFYGQWVDRKKTPISGFEADNGHIRYKGWIV